MGTCKERWRSRKGTWAQQLRTAFCSRKGRSGGPGPGLSKCYRQPTFKQLRWWEGKFGVALGQAFRQGGRHRAAAADRPTRAYSGRPALALMLLPV